MKTNGLTHDEFLTLTGFTLIVFGYYVIQRWRWAKARAQRLMLEEDHFEDERHP